MKRVSMKSENGIIHLNQVKRRIAANIPNFAAHLNEIPTAPFVLIMLVVLFFEFTDECSGRLVYQIR